MLFSGQSALGTLVEAAPGWSVGALALLIAFKALAWSVSLVGLPRRPDVPRPAARRGRRPAGPDLPGLATTPAVAVGMGAAMAAVLRLPLASVVLATLLTAHAAPASSR